MSVHMKIRFSNPDGNGTILFSEDFKRFYTELIRKLNRLRDLGNQPETPLDTVNLRVPHTPGKDH